MALEASSTTQGDIDMLRELGLTDADVADVVFAAAARSFFTKSWRWLIDHTSREPLQHQIASAARHGVATGAHRR